MKGSCSIHQVVGFNKTWNADKSAWICHGSGWSRSFDRGSGVFSYIICHKMKNTGTGNKTTKIDWILWGTGCYIEKESLFFLCVFPTENVIIILQSHREKNNFENVSFTWKTIKL